MLSLQNWKPFVCGQLEKYKEKKEMCRMQFREAKKELFKECREQLLAMGFFEKYECWYKLDFESGNIISMNCRRLASGKIMEVGFSVATMMEGVLLEHLEEAKYASGYFRIPHFEVAYADSTPGYRQYQSNEVYSIEMQLKQTLQYVQMLVFPSIKKIKTAQDLYDFCMLMFKQKPESVIVPCLYTLSTHLQDWGGALDFWDKLYLRNEQWGNRIVEAVSNNEEMRNKFKDHMVTQAAIQNELKTEKLHILSHNVSYFEKKCEKGTKITLEYIKNAFSDEIEKGIIKLG
jgi:hypothetical protein